MSQFVLQKLTRHLFQLVLSMATFLKNKSIILPFALTMLVFGCAKVSTYSTNLDRENFKHYFSPAKVEIFESEKEFPGKFKFLEGVEGDNCQAKPHLAAPDTIEARTEARRKAYDLGANAIVFSGCANIQTKQCHAAVICYGKAYVIEPTPSE